MMQMLLWGGFACTTETDAGEVELCSITVRPKQYNESRECTDGRCYIPTGFVVLGNADPFNPDQCPQHQAKITELYLSKTEVTTAEWQTCVDAGVCAPQVEWCRNFTDDTTGNIPITCVTWQDAKDYCAWQGGRLPTEAEWELGARGRLGYMWAWGNESPFCMRANYKFVTAYCEGEVAEVGLHVYGDSPFGLHDVAGNVWEWTEDWYDANAYTKRTFRDPQGPTTDCAMSTIDASGACVDKVLRGGAWDTTEGTISPAARSHTPPDTIDVNIGFRCAWDVE